MSMSPECLASLYYPLYGGGIPGNNEEDEEEGEEGEQDMPPTKHAFVVYLGYLGE